MCGFCKKKYRKNNHVKIVSLFLSHYLCNIFLYSANIPLQLKTQQKTLKFNPKKQVTCKPYQKTVNLQIHKPNDTHEQKTLYFDIIGLRFQKDLWQYHHYTFLRTFIQALIKSEVPIAKVEFDRSEIAGLTKENRGGVFDLSCIDGNGENYIIDMQLDELKKFIKRSTFYAANRYGLITKKGDFYFDKLKKIYMISFLNGIVYPNSSELHHIGKLRNQHGELMGDEITQIMFEMGKWNKPVEDIKTNLDKLIYVMKVTHTLKETDTFNPPEFWSEEWIQEAIKELDLSKMAPMEREYAERQIVKAVMYNTSMKEKEEAIRAKERAIKAKEKEREAKGKVQLQFIQQTNTSVKNLLNRNISPQEISEILNISLEKVLKIKQKLEK